MAAPDALNSALATAVRTAREGQGWSVAALAAESGVSRAMIGKVEGGTVQPTAALLAKLANALNLTLSELIARAEGGRGRLLGRDDQVVWTDPATGYRRRAVSPPVARGIELVEVELPAGAEVSYSASSFRLIDQQQLWVLEGRLAFTEGVDFYDLGPGDCLQLGPPSDCTFRNESISTCRYLVVLHKISGNRPG